MNENQTPAVNVQLSEEQVAAAKKKKLITNIVTFVITFVVVFVVGFFLLKGEITASEYNQIEYGMSYSEVCDIIGSEGKEQAGSSIGGYSSQVYMWKGPFYYITGANACITFMNGEVTGMASTGF